MLNVTILEGEVKEGNVVAWSGHATYVIYLLVLFLSTTSYFRDIPEHYQSFRDMPETLSSPSGVCRSAGETLRDIPEKPFRDIPEPTVISRRPFNLLSSLVSSV